MKTKLIFIFILTGFTSFSFSAEKDTTAFESEEVDYCAIEKTAIDNIIDTAITCVGTPYKYGGTSKQGFDCSGFLGYVFISYCGKIPRSSSAISKIGKKIDRKDIKVGDMIFFKGRNLSSSAIGHVSLVTEICDGKIKMVHATRRGVIEDVLSEINYYDVRYLFAIRLDYPQLLELY